MKKKKNRNKKYTKLYNKEIKKIVKFLCCLFDSLTKKMPKRDAIKSLKAVLIASSELIFFVERNRPNSGKSRCFLGL